MFDEVIGASCPQGGTLTTGRLERIVELLRFSRYRLTALRLRIHGASPVFGELLASRALGETGYTAQLRGGDVLFLHIGDCDETGAVRSFDAATEKALIERLSYTLAEMTQQGPRVRVLISVAHVWSDAVSDPGEVVELVTRLAPKSDITVPVHRYEAASALAMPRARAAAV